MLILISIDIQYFYKVKIAQATILMQANTCSNFHMQKTDTLPLLLPFFSNFV